MQLSDVMVRGVETIEAGASLADAARRMRDANVGVLPVIENGRLLGVLTDRDVVIRAVAEAADLRRTPVRDCATREPLTAQPDWDIDDAMELMARHQIGRLPIVDDDNRPIGMVTLGSLALRSRRDAEALSTAKTVSRRSARGGGGRTGNKTARRASGARAPGGKASSGGARSHRTATRVEPGKRHRRAGRA